MCEFNNNRELTAKCSPGYGLKKSVFSGNLKPIKCIGFNQGENII